MYESAVVAAGSVEAQQPTKARDRRPIHAYLALPRLGTQVPDFHYATVDGAGVSSASLRGAPTVLALWSTWCSASHALLHEIETLRSDYAMRGVRVVILAADSLPDLRAYSDSLHIGTVMAAAGDLDTRFDFSRMAPERDSLRVQFALPGFLVLDRGSKVVLRDIGPVFPEIRAALDTLLR